MFTQGDVDRALAALEAGESLRRAAALVGASHETVRRWAAGSRPRGGARIGGRNPGPREVGPLDDEERAAFEAAMTENMLLRAVLDDLKAAGSAPRSISNRRKAELGERLRLATGLPLREITAFLRISRSSYEYHRARLGRDKYAALRAEVRRAFEAGRGAYGYRRVGAELRRGGTRVSEKVVRRLMREEGLVARRRPGARRRAPAAAGGERPANVPRLRAEARRAAGEGFSPDHDFSAPAPGVLAVTDVTEFSVGGLRCYLSPVVDCYDGMPAAWSLSRAPDADLCVSSLRSYLGSLPPGSSPVVHTDGGAPYRSWAWRDACERGGASRSMSRPGRSGDNAPAEGFFGTLKAEFLGGRDWSGVGLGEFRRELDDYLRWYRSGRLKGFDGPGGRSYETIEGRRRRLGLPV